MYALTLTEAEIRTVHELLAEHTPQRPMASPNDPLVSVADKFAWSVAFLDDPVVFSGELTAMETDDDEPQSIELWRY
jgi:hypothetical protein